MTSTLLVARADAPSVQSSMILKETLRPFLAKMESGAVSRPPLATRPPTQPTHTFTRMRTSAFSSVLDETGSSRGLEVSTLSPLDELLLLPPNLLLSMTPYLTRL